MSWRDRLEESHSAIDMPLLKVGGTEVSLATLISAVLIVLIAF